MKVTQGQFRIVTALTLCAVVWLLLLTCYREYWGFWLSPETYHFLSKEYPEWFRDYIRSYYHPTLLFTLFAYAGWVSLCVQRWGISLPARVALLGLTLLFGATLGVMCSNNLIHFLDSGHLHGKTHLRDRE